MVCATRGESVDTFWQSDCGKWQEIDLHRSRKTIAPAKVLKCLEENRHTTATDWLPAVPSASSPLHLLPTAKALMRSPHVFLSSSVFSLTARTTRIQQGHTCSTAPWWAESFLWMKAAEVKAFPLLPWNCAHLDWFLTDLTLLLAERIYSNFCARRWCHSRY